MGKKFILRTRGVLVVFAALLAFFAWVLYDLQVVHGSEYLAQSTRKIASIETVPAARGALLDRYGRVLADNRVTYRVTLDAKSMGDTQSRNSTILALIRACGEQGVTWNDSLPVTAAPPFHYTTAAPYEVVSVDDEGTETRQATRLALLCGKYRKLSSLVPDATARELVDALRSYFEVDESLSDADGRAVVGVLYELALRDKDVARSTYVFTSDVNINFITVVKERQLAGVKIEQATIRQYHTKYAAHILGQVGPIYAEEWDDYKDKGYSMNDTVGKFGVEQAFEALLRGTPGTRNVELSQSGKVVSESWVVDAGTGEEQVPQPGSNVMLTLDIKLQEVVEEALARHIPGMTAESEKGACVITDMSGGVLALASYPTYDPTTYYTNYNDLLADPLRPLVNRALQETYSPGSTIKMAIASGALQEGVITRTERILCTGRYRHYQRIQDQPQCWIYRQYGGTHGYETVSEAIRDSCNIFFYETGLRLGIDRLDQYCALFGLGETTGLELYEEKGEVAGPATSERHGQDWFEGETMYAAIGQGNTRVTPIQLCNYIATLANGGYHYPTHLLKTVKSEDFSRVESEYQPVPRDEIGLDEANVAAVKHGMELLATTGSVAPYFRSLPVKIGAKTGTAQVAADAEANAIFVAFAPYDDPQIAITVVVERGGSGTPVAAIARDILEYYFSAGDALESVPGENTLIR